jgi:hypothetical protein
LGWPDDGAFWVVDVLAFMQDKTSSDGWKLDSGATQHITNSTTSYTSFTSYGTAKLLMVGKAAVHLQALGEGTIMLSVPSGDGQGSTTLELTKVWYCPDCPFQLISTRRIVQGGSEIRLDAEKAVIWSHGRPAIMLPMDSAGLYSFGAKMTAAPEEVLGMTGGHLSRGMKSKPCQCQYQCLSSGVNSGMNSGVNSGVNAHAIANVNANANVKCLSGVGP